MLVMKFGGTSVGVPEHFQIAARLVAGCQARDPVVVVSALTGITNLLVDFCRQPGLRPELEARFVERHVAIARAVSVEPVHLAPLLDAWREEAESHRMDRAPIVGEHRDRVLSFGERLSAELFAAALKGRGVDAVAVLAGDAGLVTDDRFGAAHPLP